MSDTLELEGWLYVGCGPREIGHYVWEHTGQKFRHHTINFNWCDGSWIAADWLDGFNGWTCCIEQGAYGHRARKKTWLYAHGVDLPSLDWGRADGEFLPMEHGFHSKEEREQWKRTGEAPAYIKRATKTGICQRLSKRQRAATPEEFRDLLLEIARSAYGSQAHGLKSASGTLNTNGESNV